MPLGQVHGRIDHLGIYLKRQRLLVAELGNNSLGVVDPAAGKVLSMIAGLSEPQGVAYVPSSDSVFVANAGAGSVRVLRGEDLAPIRRIELGDDADNVRVDPARNQVLVGYGRGARPCQPGEDRGHSSQSASGGVSNRRNRDPALCECAGRA